MNKEVAYLLSHIYSSNESVLTNILQYQYQLFFLDSKEMQEKMGEILKLEFKHLEWLGNLIKGFGCIPIYADIQFGIVEFWNSNAVYYDTDVLTILDVDIEGKKKEISNCKMLMYTVKNEDVTRVLQEIVDEDYKILRWFMKLKCNYSCLE